MSTTTSSSVLASQVDTSPASPSQMAAVTTPSNPSKVVRNNRGTIMDNLRSLFSSKPVSIMAVVEAEDMLSKIESSCESDQNDFAAAAAAQDTEEQGETNNADTRGESGSNNGSNNGSNSCKVVQPNDKRPIEIAPKSNVGFSIRIPRANTFGSIVQKLRTKTIRKDVALKRDSEKRSPLTANSSLDNCDQQLVDPTKKSRSCTILPSQLTIAPQETSLIIGENLPSAVSLQDLKAKAMSNQKYGFLTVEQMLEFGIRYGFSQDKFNTIFTMTYKTFSTAMNMVTNIRKIFSTLQSSSSDDNDSKQMASHICKFLGKWINECYMDFQFETPVIDEIFLFIAQLGDATHTDEAQQLAQQFGLLTSGQKTLAQAKTQVTPRVLIQSKILKMDPRTIALDQLNPVEVARQITLMEFGIFEKITPEELLTLGWATDSKEWVAPNITQLISKSNSITEWVTQCLLKTESLRLRRNLLRMFIEICDACLEMNNFNTLFEIMMSLTSQPIYRLKQTWQGLAKHETAKFKNFEKITSFNNNRKPYREAVAAVVFDMLRSANKDTVNFKSVLPYVGVHLTDLVFFDQGNPSQKLENDHVLVNFTKRSLMADVVQLLKTCQKTPYNFECVDILQQFLHAQFQVVEMVEEEMYKCSKQLEQN